MDGRRMILVTGASGFLGNHVARLLLERGEAVRALVRPTSSPRPLEGLDLDVRIGDLRDPASLKPAVAGCRQIYHVAADYRLWARRPREMYASNVEGTRNLLKAAAGAGAERIVYTSTVGTIGIPADGSPGTEAAPVSLNDMAGHYKRSKFLAEQAALEFAANGLPVTIVNPTAPIGERDFKPTPTGRIVLDFLAGRMPAFVDTGLNVVDVRDAARGHLQAAEKGRPGERYLLGGENLTLKELFERMAEATGLPAPTIRMPYAAAFAAGAVSTAWARLSGMEPRIPLDGVRATGKRTFIDTSKARKELGFEAGPATAAIERAAAWFRRQ